MRADGAGGLISRSLYLGSWTGAITSSVSCAGGPRRSSSDPPLAKLLQMARNFLSHHNLLPPTLHSTTLTQNHSI